MFLFHLLTFTSSWRKDALVMPRQDGRTPSLAGKGGEGGGDGACDREEFCSDGEEVLSDNEEFGRDSEEVLTDNEEVGRGSEEVGVETAQFFNST